MKSIGSLVAVLLVAMLSPSAAAEPASKPSTIQAQGHGEAIARGDTLSMRIGVNTSASTGDEAAQANADAVAKLTAALNEKLAGQGTIIRSNYFMNPTYDSSGPPRAQPGADEQIRIEFPPRSVTSEQAARLTDTIKSDFVVMQGFESGGEGHGTIIYEVRSTAATAAEAVRLNNERSAKVIEAVKRILGNQVTVKSTSSISDDMTPLVPSARSPQKSSSPTGYAAHSEIMVESRRIDLLPVLIRTISGAADASLNAVTFLLRDRTAAQGEAIAKATKDAESKAQAEAAALGVRLGPMIKSAVDLASGSSPVGASGGGAGVTTLSSAGAATQPSDVKVSANVVLTYTVQ